MLETICTKNFILEQLDENIPEYQKTTLDSYVSRVSLPENTSVSCIDLNEEFLFIATKSGHVLKTSLQAIDNSHFQSVVNLKMHIEKMYALFVRLIMVTESALFIYNTHLKIQEIKIDLDTKLKTLLIVKDGIIFVTESLISMYGIDTFSVIWSFPLQNFDNIDFKIFYIKDIVWAVEEQKGKGGQIIKLLDSHLKELPTVKVPDNLDIIKNGYATKHAMYVLNKNTKILYLFESASSKSRIIERNVQMVATGNDSIWVKYEKDPSLWKYWKPVVPERKPINFEQVGFKNGGGDVSDCINKNALTLEDYTKQEDPFRLYIGTGTEFKKALCITQEELKSYVLADIMNLDINTHIPYNVMALYTEPLDGNYSGFGAKPTFKWIYKLPVNNVYITLGSFMNLINNKHVKEWYLKELDVSRIGNIFGVFGMSMTHGQFPGSRIYRLISTEKLKKKSESDWVGEENYEDEFIEKEEAIKYLTELNRKLINSFISYA